MFDGIGWTELLVVAIIAIVFIGPKELPAMLRTFGRVIKKIRGMASEFQGQFNEALKEAELDGLKDTIDDVRSLDPTKSIKDKLNPLKSDLEKSVEVDKKTPDKTPQEIEAEIARDHENYKKQALGDTGKSAGENAVPGFSSAPEPAAKPAKPKTARKAPAKKAPKNTATKKTKPAAKRKPAKKAAVGTT